MTKADIAELVTILVAAFPNTKFSPSTSSVYETALADLDKELCSRAIVNLIGTSKFMPSIAEVREACVLLRFGRRRPGGDAWGDVVKAMKRYGYTRTPGIDFVFDDPLVMRAVSAFGWQDLCGSENSVADRARFIELFDQLASNSRSDTQITPGLVLPSSEQRQLGARPLNQLLDERNKP